MQINIAICDDEPEICSQIEEILIEILKRKKIKYEIDIYMDGENLCSGMKKENYNLVFIDIELPKMNGVEIGTYIREKLKDEKIQIAYISAKESYAMELFESRPINFLVKPLNYEKIKKVVDKYNVLSEDDNRIFTYSKGHEFYNIQLSQILYFESDNRKIRIVKEDGTDEFYDSLESIYGRVKRYKFLYVHKSYIVNYKYVKKVAYDKVTMNNGKEISISQSRRRIIRMMFMEIRKGEI